MDVQEKVRGKTRLVPRLLGIARDSVMRVDETTKEIIKSWPLFTVRRWAASHNSFTIVSHLPCPSLRRFHDPLYTNSLHFPQPHIQHSSFSLRILVITLRHSTRYRQWKETRSLVSFPLTSNLFWRPCPKLPWSCPMMTKSQ